MADETNTVFGGPKATTAISALAVAILGLVALKLLDLSTFSAVAIVFIAALTIGAARSAQRNGIQRGVQFVGFSVISAAILFTLGASGILSFSDQLAWSGLSAFAGVAAGSAVLKLFLDTTRSNR